METKHVTVNGIEYPIHVTPIGQKAMHVRCDAANINQEFLIEDAEAVLLNMHNLISTHDL